MAVLMAEPLSALHAMLGQIRRETDAARLNAVVNHPDVLPWVQGDRPVPLDLSEAVADPRNVVLMGKHGGILFHHIEPGLYEAHTSVLPAGRGAWCLAMVEAALHWMFCRTDAVEIMTMVPKGNLAARALTRAAGLEYRLTRPDAWTFRGRRVDADISSLTLHGWMERAKGPAARGAAVLKQIRADLARHGASFSLDGAGGLAGAVGLSVELFLGWQVQKSVVSFRRWSRLAGAEPLKVVSLMPLAVEIGNATVVIRDTGEVYVATFAEAA